jgi:hypothetical protein
MLIIKQKIYFHFGNDFDHYYDFNYYFYFDFV